MPSTTEGKNSGGYPHYNLPPEGVIFGSSEAMQGVRQTLEKAAATTAPVLITGETGTGKEVLATQFHLRSPWLEGPFFKINCPVLRPSFGGNDPFGEALTAAAPPLAAKAGGEQIPRRGTLFLNEIALLDRALQVRLMERIEEGPLLRTGPLDGQGLELRVICVTSRQLQGEVATGTFLRELFYMVRVVTLELPPLRQRRGDIPELARYFLDHYNREFRTTTPPPPPRIMDRMRGYDWPGNIRELENLIMRHALQGSEDAFAGELGSRNPSSSAGISSTDMIPLKKAARDAAHEWERKVILKVLEEHHWNRREAARALNISYTALLYKIKNAGIPPQRNKQGECHPRP